jgi:hypothetical protein
MSEFAFGLAGLATLSLESPGGLGGCSRIMLNKEAGADDPFCILRFTTPLVVLDFGEEKCFLLTFCEPIGRNIEA